jgi:glycosyltransferase involved in cell wall biosynthesis
MFSLHIDTGRDWRGTQGQTLHTVLGMRAIGHRAALVAHPDGELRQRMSGGDDVVPLTSRREVDMDAAWNLSRVVKQLRPQVVHIHDPSALAMAATALSILAPEPRPVLVASQRTAQHIPHDSFSQWTQTQVDCFIANSRFVQDHLVSDGIPRARTTTVSDGVDIERIVKLPTANVHAACFLPTHAPIVGTVGSLTPQNGLHHLIDAATLVVREVPDVRFVIIGDGELRESLERHVHETHLERHVFLTGFKVNALEFIKGFDLLAVSSISGGIYTALVDAMAASKAAVATAAGGIPEAVVDNETGFLVPPRDHRAMADKLVVLLKDPDLSRRMGAAALARARERFAVERMVAETVAVYERLMIAG